MMLSKLNSGACYFSTQSNSRKHFSQRKPNCLKGSAKPFMVWPSSKPSPTACRTCPHLLSHSHRDLLSFSQDSTQFHQWTWHLLFPRPGGFFRRSQHVLSLTPPPDKSEQTVPLRHSSVLFKNPFSPGLTVVIKQGKTRNSVHSEEIAKR